MMTTTSPLGVNGSKKSFSSFFPVGTGFTTAPCQSTPPPPLNQRPTRNSADTLLQNHPCHK
eukprot:9498774-Pyramimonas_sp.AAC.1